MFTKKYSVVLASIVVAVVVVASITLSVNYSSTDLSTSDSSGTAVFGLLDPWSIQDVSDNSLYIVKGTVKDLIVTVDEKGERFGDKPIVFTDAVIAIEEEFTGKYSGKEITVRTVGGQTSEHKTTSHIHAGFEPNEQVVVFIGYEPESEMGDNYFPMGHIMGKYQLKNGKAFGYDYKDGFNQEQFLSDVRQMNTR